jgi:hypothetical protein
MLRMALTRWWEGSDIALGNLLSTKHLELPSEILSEVQCSLKAY